VALVASAGVLAFPLLHAAPARAASLAVPQDLRLVNYYPAHNGWTYMWRRWDRAAIDADFSRIASLNANTVRLIVQTPAFGWPEPTPRYTRRLADVVGLADAHGLHVELTLFDWWGGYKQVRKSELWARSIVAPYAGDPRIVTIELQNEMDPTNVKATTWARTLLPYLRQIDGGIPVTLSVSGHDPIAGIRAMRQALGSAALPDYWSFHYYDKPELAYQTFQQAQQAAAPQPLFVGETGYWPGDSDPPVTSVADREDEQVRYLRTVETAAHLLGLPAVAPWILSDFSRSAIPNRVRDVEYHFGLFRVDGTPKPAAEAVRAFFGNQAPDAGFDQGFEQPLAGEAALPASWHRRGAGSFARDVGVAHDGDASASIGGVRGRPTVRARFWTIPTVPWVTSGATVTAGVWARGEAATGTTRISVLFFDGSRHFIGEADSTPLATGTTDWTQLTAPAIVPPTAAYVRLELSSDADSGRVWFDDVSFG